MAEDVPQLPIRGVTRRHGRQTVHISPSQGTKRATENKLFYDLAVAVRLLLAELNSRGTLSEVTFS